MQHHRIYRPLFTAIDAAGWRVVKAKHGCLAFPANPALAPIAVGGTTSDWRAWRNVRARLRRAGLDV